MPKFAVMVERMVPQWRVVIVDADKAEDIDKDTALGEKIWNAACALDGWEYDDDSPSAEEPSTISVVDAEEWKTDLEDDADVQARERTGARSHNDKIMRYLDVNGRMSDRDVADAVCGGMREKVESLCWRESLREGGPRWEAVEAIHGGKGIWYAMVGEDR